MTVQSPSSGIRTEIAGQSIRELADAHGTPTYVYDAQTIVERLEQLRSFDVVRYAQKACSNLAILDLMRNQGALVDAVSLGELLRSRRVGFEFQGDPPPVVYTADIFDRRTLEYVVENDVHCNVGSIDMIDQLGERASGRRITLRINPGFGHGHSQKTNTGGDQSKHGIWFEELDSCLQKADFHGLQISGLHMHIGSGTDFEHLSQVASAMESAARRVGRIVTSISTGGGLPIPYRQEDRQLDTDRYFQLWDVTRKRLEDEFGHRISLEIEPGRFLTAESGFLVCEIRAIKRMGENLFYLVDAGFNNLARPILYGAYHPMSISPQRDRGNLAMQSVVVGGPLCESGDIFTQEEGGFVAARNLPQAEVGDLLTIECAGAYGFVMSSNYNSKPFASEVLIKDGQSHLIRERQSEDALFADEIIP